MAKKKYIVTSNLLTHKDLEQFVSKMGRELYLLIKLGKSSDTCKDFRSNKMKIRGL